MTATDKLRRLLDERGMEWDYGIAGATTTRFTVNRVDLTFTPMRDGLVCSTILTPEQAIAATLGVGTCHKLPASGEKTCIVRHNSTHLMMEFGYWRCSECGCECFDGARYCMGCGRKVVDDG